MKEKRFASSPVKPSDLAQGAGFTPLHPQSLGFQTQDKWKIKLELLEKAPPFRRGVTGFTLIEALVVSVILLILIGLLTASGMGVYSIFETSDISVMLQADARSAMNRVILDLVKTSTGQISITQNAPFAGSDTITYYLPADSDEDGIPDLDNQGNIIWGDAVMFRLDPAGTNMLLRETGGNMETLASNVKKINFVDHNINSSLYLDELNIFLELEKTTPKGRTYNTPVTSIVNMRN